MTLRLAAVVLTVAGFAVWSGPARALAPGDLDPTFGSGGTVTSSVGGDVFAVALQPDGKIVIAGSNRDSNDKSQALIARLNSDGSFDSSFGTGGVVAVQLGEGATKQSAVDALALQPDGKILTGGYATDASGHGVFLAVRLNADGTFDSSFGTDGKLITAQFDAGMTPESDLNALAVLPDGEILAGGDATDSDGHTAFLVVRLTSAGNPDSSYATGGKLLTQLGVGSNRSSSVTAMSLQPDGKPIVAGYATDSASRAEFLVTRLNTGGSPDATFAGGRVLTQLGQGPAPSSSADAVALQPDGKILAGGYATDSAGNAASLIVRLDNGGTFDPSFAANGELLDQLVPSGGPFVPASFVRGIAPQPNGRILAAGRANGFFAARLDGAGAFDPSFGSGGLVFSTLGQIRSVALQPDGKLVAAGDGTDSGGNGFLMVTRLIADLPPTPSFSATPNPAAPGKVVAFNGSGSTDDGTITNYSWNFGDGGSASGPTATHSYAKPGTYTAALTVRDDYGLSAVATHAITVSAAPVLRALRLRPRSFPAAARGGSIARRTGTTVSYRDSEAVTTRFRVERVLPGRRSGHRCVAPRARNRHAKRCVRYSRVRGGFSHHDKAGTNRFHFTGRMRRRKLPPGNYRLDATPSAGGAKSHTARTRFRIIH
ncbi:MAG TPA: PKD domain-containing protein [Thermoleophilaceae bacterium]